MSAGPCPPLPMALIYAAKAQQSLTRKSPTEANIVVSPHHRTPEQIRAQLEAAMIKLERDAVEHEDRKKRERERQRIACTQCRWAVSRDRDGIWPWICSQPLIVGFKRRDEWPRVQGSNPGEETPHALCGPEKALWEPRLSLPRRLINCFLDPWRKA